MMERLWRGYGPAQILESDRICASVSLPKQLDGKGQAKGDRSSPSWFPGGRHSPILQKGLLHRGCRELLSAKAIPTERKPTGESRGPSTVQDQDHRLAVTSGSIDASDRHSGDRVSPVGGGGIDIACALNLITDVNEAFGLSRIVDVIATRGERRPSRSWRTWWRCGGRSERSPAWRNPPMMVSFGGGGGGTAEYLTGEKDSEGREREGVEVLIGDPSEVQAVADSLEFAHQSTTGVIAWAPEDNPTDGQIGEVLQEFEQTAWARLEPDRYAWSAVQHRDAKGGVHVHVFTARVDLETGKSLNIAPPGWEKTFGTLRDWQNCKHGWSRPDDPARARVLQQDFRAYREASERRGGRGRPKDPHRLRGRPHRERERHGSRLPGGRLEGGRSGGPPPGQELHHRAGTQNHRGAGG